MANKTTTLPPDHITVELQRPTALTKDAAKLTATAALLSNIGSAQVAQEAGQFLRGLRERQRRIKAHYLDVRRPLNKALDDIRAMEKADLAPWEQADKTIAAALLTWQSEQERLAREENRRRLADAEEQARKQREEQAAAIRAAAVTAPTKAVAKTLERQAKQVEQAPLLPVAVAAVDTPKVDGISIPKRKKAEVLDFAALVRAVAAGIVPIAALEPNQAFLDGQAKALGAHLNYPGVVVRELPTLSARSL